MVGKARPATRTSTNVWMTFADSTLHVPTSRVIFAVIATRVTHCIPKRNVRVSEGGC